MDNRTRATRIWRINTDLPHGFDTRGQIYPRNGSDEEVRVQYQVGDGMIHARPWPFSAGSYESYLIAYRSDGYPDRLDPLILPYRLVQTQ